MKNYYWNIESWGEAYPPENADEIIDAANEKIDAFIAANPDADDSEIFEYSGRLWEDYCQYDDTVREIIDGGLFDQAVELMDDNIREAIHAELAPCSEYIFLLEYMIRHSAKYGEDFTI